MKRPAPRADASSRSSAHAAAPSDGLLYGEAPRALRGSMEHATNSRSPSSTRSARSRRTTGCSTKTRSKSRCRNCEKKIVARAVRRDAAWAVRGRRASRRRARLDGGSRDRARSPRASARCALGLRSPSKDAVPLLRALAKPRSTSRPPSSARWAIAELGDKNDPRAISRTLAAVRRRAFGEL